MEIDKYSEHRVLRFQTSSDLISSMSDFSPETFQNTFLKDLIILCLNPVENWPLFCNQLFYFIYFYGCRFTTNFEFLFTPMAAVLIKLLSFIYSPGNHFTNNSILLFTPIADIWQPTLPFFSYIWALYEFCACLYVCVCVCACVCAHVYVRILVCDLYRWFTHWAVTIKKFLSETNS